MELYDKQEPLCEALEPYVTEGKFLGKMIHHPLIIETLFDPNRCALINERYRLKMEALAKAKTENKWSSYVFLHERPYRVDALCRAIGLGAQIDPDLVSEVWIDSENIWQHKQTWQTIWKALPDPHMTMDDNERAVYNLMPDKISIHRGIRHKGHNRRGMSWTRDKERASWFANRWKGQKGLQPVVLSTEVKKKDILAYFNGRGEEEVVIMPSKLRKLTEFQIG